MRLIVATFEQNKAAAIIIQFKFFSINNKLLLFQSSATSCCLLLCGTFPRIQFELQFDWIRARDEREQHWLVGKSNFRVKAL